MFLRSLVFGEAVSVEGTQAVVECTENDHLAIQQLVYTATPPQQQLCKAAQTGLAHVQRIRHSHADVR